MENIQNMTNYTAKEIKIYVEKTEPMFFEDHREVLHYIIEGTKLSKLKRLAHYTRLANTIAYFHVKNIRPKVRIGFMAKEDIENCIFSMAMANFLEMLELEDRRATIDRCVELADSCMKTFNKYNGEHTK